MAGGSPNLFPSGFLEFKDSCTGPLLYRDQPNRESSGIVLSNFMNKYVTRNEQFNPTRTLTYIQYLNNNWNKLDKDLKKDLLQLLKGSNGNIGKAILNKNSMGASIKEFFGDTNTNTNTGAAGGGAITLKKDNNVSMNVFIIVIVAIISIVLGYMICSI